MQFIHNLFVFNSHLYLPKYLEFGFSKIIFAGASNPYEKQSFLLLIRKFVE